MAEEDRPLLPASTGAKRYVALGDSFSSGEGAPIDIQHGGLLDDGPFGMFEDESYKAFYGDPADDGYACHRSPSSYPVVVHAALGPEWGLDLRACSGAVFAELDRDAERRSTSDERLRRRFCRPSHDDYGRE